MTSAASCLVNGEVNEMMLKRILNALPGTFSRLVITADFRILLPDFEKEIV
jgi:hypothetical protein